MREAFMMGGPQDGKRYAVQDDTSRLVFETTLNPRGLEALRKANPDAPVPILEHRYDYTGTRLSDGSFVFDYEGLHPAPIQEGE
jgi:hypothetical protein